MPSNTDDDESEAPFPTLDYGGPPTFSSHLSPDDAFISPPRRGYGVKGADRGGTGRRRRRAWKKLMWVKQSCRSTTPSSTATPWRCRHLGMLTTNDDA